MKTYARIDNGLVAELFSTDGNIADLFHPDLLWVDTNGATVAPGYTYDGKAFTAPVVVPPSVAALRAAQLARINADCDAAVGQLRGGYPDNEVQSWDKQEREAEAYTASNTASTPLLSALASARGLSLSDLAARVMQKAAAFAQQSGALIGKRQALEDQLNTISDTDPDAAAKIAAINW